MILLDTNVISEPLRKQPDAAVVQWLDAQAPDTLHISSISLAELLLGVARMPDGRRKDTLAHDLALLIEELFADRILPFDAEAAKTYASVVAQATSRGRTIGVADGQIASIARLHQFSVASRDVVPFHAAGLTVINPFEML